MSDSTVVKDGKVYVIRFYSKKWKGSAFFRGKVNGEPKYTKLVKNAKDYVRPGNANIVADKLTEHTGVVHRLAIKY